MKLNQFLMSVAGDTTVRFINDDDRTYTETIQAEVNKFFNGRKDFLLNHHVRHVSIQENVLVIRYTKEVC